MLKPILKSHLLLICLMMALPSARATHVAGADIAYQQIAPYKFKVVYRVYRTCKDLPLSAIDFKVSCENGSNTKVLTASRTSIRDISEICSKDTPPCSPQNTTTNGGLEEHTFEVTVDFNQAPFTDIKNACCKAVFSASTCCRNGAVTNISPGNFYLDAMVDLCATAANGNSSPEFRSRPMLNICCNQPFTYNSGGVETADGDSLSFELSSPLKGLNDPEIYTGSFNQSIPMTPYCPPNPGVLNCRALPGAKPPRGFYFDNENGDVIFTPTNCSEAGVVVFTVKEWRKDSSGIMRLIGYVKRESTWYVQICTDNNPPYITGTNKYSICEGEKICFNIATKDDPYLPNQTTADTVTVSWDSGIAGAQFMIANPAAREKDVHFCWQTAEGDARAAAYRFTAHVADNYCSPPARASRTYTIQVKPKAQSTRVYSKLFKGSMSFYALPADTAKHKDYRFQCTIRDSSNSGTPLFVSYNQRDTFMFPTAGRYYVEHVINNPPYNCPTVYVDSITITAEHMLKLNTEVRGDLQVFPNPGNGFIHIRSSALQLENALLRVYGADGRLICEKRNTASGVDLTALVSGLYTLEIQAGDDRIYRPLLIE